MKLSVIILNYNVSAFLDLCLRSVTEALVHLDSEIIVVDNNSTDDSIQMVKEYYPDPTDVKEKFVAVDVKALKTLKYPVSLDQIKKNKHLKNLPLIKQSRLSVMPIKLSEYKEIIRISKKND